MNLSCRITRNLERRDNIMAKAEIWDLSDLFYEIENAIGMFGLSEYFDNIDKWRLSRAGVATMSAFARRHKKCRAKQGDCDCCPFNVFCDLSDDGLDALELSKYKDTGII